MIRIRGTLATPEDVLALTPRQIAGVLLELINADATTSRYHPRTIRNDVLSEYGNNTRGNAVFQKVSSALDLLRDEKFIFKDYADNVDPEWFVVTEKGHGIRDRRQIEEVVSLLDSPRALVFVSCGQTTDAERKLGSDIVKLVEEHTDCVGYFAQNQPSLDSLSNNVLRALNRSAGLVVIMHKRGLIETPSGRHFRASVWIEQEIAMAAILRNAGLDLPVAAYIEKGIEREGIRQLIQLNELVFERDEEVIADFESKLQTGRFAITSARPAVAPAAAQVSSEPAPLLRVDALILSPDESRNLGIHPATNATRLVLRIQNAGRGPAINVTIEMNGGRFSGIPESVGPIGPSMPPLYQPCAVNTDGVGMVDPNSAPQTILVCYDGIGWRNGRVVLEKVEGTYPPAWKVTENRPPHR